MTTLLRLPAVALRTGLKRTAIYERIAAGLLPPPIKLGPRASVWPAGEIDACNDAVIRGDSDETMRALVKKLLADRQHQPEKEPSWITQTPKPWASWTDPATSPTPACPAG